MSEFDTDEGWQFPDGPSTLGPDDKAIQVIEARIEHGRAHLSGASLDVMNEIAALTADAQLLRSYSVRKNKQGVDEIYNPLVYTKAIQLRAQILKTAVGIMREVWDIKAMSDFYDAVIRCVAAESPSCAHRIISELEKLNPPVAGALARAINE